MKSENKYNNKGISHLDDAVVINYLNGKLSDAERHSLESTLMGDDFGADALEGLQHLNNSTEISTVHNNLHRFINRKITNKKSSQKTAIGFPMWIILLIAVLLTVTIFGYLIINQLTK